MKSLSISHFSLWNEEEKAFVFVGFLFVFLSLLGRVIEREIPQSQPSD